MTRRTVLFLVLDWIVLRAKARDDLRCFIDGRRGDERALARDECVFVDGRWRSGRFYAQ